MQIKGEKTTKWVLNHIHVTEFTIVVLNNMYSCVKYTFSSDSLIISAKHRYCYEILYFSFFFRRCCLVQCVSFLFLAISISLSSLLNLVIFLARWNSKGMFKDKANIWRARAKQQQQATNSSFYSSILFVSYDYFIFTRKIIFTFFFVVLCEEKEETK